MKQLVRKIVLFLLPLSVLAIGLEIIVEAIPNSYSYKNGYLEAHTKDIRTLVLGSSNAYDGICAYELPAGFNLANSGQALKEDYLLLNRSIGSLDSLERVILALGYHSLSIYQAPQRRQYYTIYMHIFPRWPLTRYSFEVYDLQRTVRKISQYLRTGDVTRCDSLGQRLYYEGEKNAEGKRDMQIDFLVQNDSFDVTSQRSTVDSCAKYLHGIDSLCRRHQVQLIVVQMPVLKEYKERIPAEQKALQDSLLRSLDPVAIYIDHSAWPLSPDDCYNATHISKATSVPYTRHLREEIDKRR